MQAKRQLEKKTDELIAKRNDIESRLRELEKEVIDRAGVERELNDQLRVRGLRAQLKQCDQELSELKKEQQGFEHTSYESKMHDLKKQQERLIDTVILLCLKLNLTFINAICDI